MKQIFIMILLSFPMGAFAATPSYVPNADNEGGIGTAAKTWNAGYFKDVTLDFGVSAATIAVSGQSLFNGTANHVSTITNRGVISADQFNAIFGVNVATGAFSGAVAITGQATFDGTANHVSTISNRGVISADQVSLVFGVSAATGAFTGAVAIAGAATFDGTANHVATISARGVISGDQVNSVFGVSAATAAITGAVQIGGVKMSSFTADGFLDVPADIKSAYLNITSTANVAGIFTSSATVNTWTQEIAQKTAAQLAGLVHTKAGLLLFCTDCVNLGGGSVGRGGLVISTGQGVGFWMDVSSGSVVAQ